MWHSCERAASEPSARVRSKTTTVGCHDVRLGNTPVGILHLGAWNVTFSGDGSDTLRAVRESQPHLDKYELIEELGHGAMATVYLAVDRRLGRQVAVKVIHRHLRDDAEVAERFAREARAVAMLRHPNIVEVYDVSEPDEKDRYLTVELVRGPTLRSLLRDRGHLPTEVAAGIGVEIARALQHAHDHGVVHRDVKPENVLLALRASDGANASAGFEGPPRVQVKITDFGIAKVLELQGVTSTGEVLGSPAHMAPEQIEGHNVGPRADVFALGVLLYECMVGRLPFDGTNPAQVLRKVLDGSHLAAERARPTVGSGFGRIVERALAHDPNDRYATAGALADALLGELEGTGLGDPQQELLGYITDADSYEASYPSRIVGLLVRQARQARDRRNVQQAATLFNRALAFRPDDAEIVSEIAQLSRRQRLRRVLGRSALAAASISLLIVGVLWASEHWQSHGPTKREAAELPMVQKQPKFGKSPAPAKVDSATRIAATPEPPEKHHRIVTHAASPRAASSSKPRTRAVQVIVSGAAGSQLLIDGTERPWFGVTHQLELGDHVFSAIPPDDTCCVAPAPKTITITAGQTLQKVHLSVEFRPAYIRLSAPPGTTLSCGELFPGLIEAPGRRAVRVSRANTHATCTLLPPPDSPQHPRSIDVVLRPGGSFTVSGP